MNELALFAGAGGGILGGKLLGWRTVCAVEFAPYPRSVLLARQRDGVLEPFPIWDDVRTFDGHPWRGHVDVVSGGFPCQDISVSGGGLDLQESAPACGLKWRESLARFDRGSCSWRTAQPLFPEDSTEFLGILPAWGSMRNGELFPQPIVAPRTCGNESGFWPTLLASDGPNGGPNSRGSKGDLRLSAAVHTFPPLKARDYRSGSKPESRRARAQRTGEVHSPDLNDVIAPGGQLNPTWCEWFMGFPEGWTELKPLEILKFQQWRRSHSKRCAAA
jgi:DNA (cytosine-5)-methyltransferase 1